MSPDAVRYAGIVVELVGLALVAWGIWDTARRFDRPVTAAVRKALQQLLARRQRRPDITVTGATGTENTTAFSGTPRVQPANPTVEDRLAYLEERMQRAENQHAALDAQLRREVDDRRATDDQERQARERTDRNVSGLLQQHAAGGLGKQALGVGCFAFGLLLRTCRMR